MSQGTGRRLSGRTRTSACWGEAVVVDPQEQPVGEVGVLRRPADAGAPEPDAGAASAQLALEAPWQNPEPWWLRGGVRPYLVLADIGAFVIATVITQPTNPVHGVVLLVYLA